MIETYGYSQSWKAAFEAEGGETLSPIRILAEHKSQYVAATDCGELPAQVSGYLRQLIAVGKQPSPAVGDFAAAYIPETRDRAVIEAILPRRSVFVRMDSFKGGRQALAANFDTALLCSSLNREFNIARMERYLVMGRESGASLAIVLTKADLCEEPELFVQMCKAVSGEVPVHVVSAVTGEGLPSLAPYFASGQTVVALGSSGVGKSTLVNALFGQEIMQVAAIREDDAKGRHTTVHRQIVLLPSGGLYMDTPGMRELGLYDAQESVNDTFSQVAALAQGCRFDDCRHEGEPDCAVRRALEMGELEASVYKRYKKLLRESAYAGNSPEYRREKTRFHKALSKSTRTSRKG